MDQHNWIVSVLDDIRVYARQNQLNEIAISLGSTMILAQVEIGLSSGVDWVDSSGEITGNRTIGNGGSGLPRNFPSNWNQSPAQRRGGK